MRFIGIILSVSIILVPATLFSNPEALSLNRSWELMKANDPSLKASEQTIVEKKGDKTSALSAFLPRLQGNVSIRNYIKEEGFIWDSGSFGMGIVPFPSTDDTVPSYSISFEQMLFDSGRSIAGFKAAQEALTAATYADFAYRQQRAIDLVVAYCRYYMAKKNIETAKTSLDAYAELERVANLRFREGFVQKTDLLSAEVSKEKSRLDLIEAEDNVRVTQMALETLIGETPRDIEAPEVPRPTSLSPDEMERPEIKAKQAEMMAAKMEASRASFSYLPEFYAKAEAAYIDDSYRINKAQYTFMGGMRWPLFDGTYHMGRRKAALAQSMRSKWEKEAMENSFSVELLDARQIWDRSGEEIEISKLNRVKSGENLKNARLSYAEGMVSALDVRDAVRLWSESEHQYYQTLCNKQLSAAKLRQAAGVEILEP